MIIFSQCTYMDLKDSTYSRLSIMQVDAVGDL